ncbi:MAG: FtsK/SpoIIIE domain-containing protein [Aeromicrobium sp.]|uniref:FtsK/SpoIIIE domain-containing protein n=1 Tax=Aeromicrobium sp. TaxID=1871063 RepID=UPI0039E6645F
MRILIDLDGRRETVDVQAWQPDATLATLLDYVGVQVDADASLILDGATVEASSLLEELTLLEGSILTRTVTHPVRTLPTWNVSVGGGLQTRPAVAIPTHRQLVIGRAPQADVVLPSESASWHHCTIEIEDDGVRLRDSNSTNGTIVDGEPIDEEGVLITTPRTVLVGGSVLNIRPSLEEPVAPAPGSLRNLTLAATAPFNRPPRPGRPPAPESIDPPAPKEVPPPGKFSLITIAAPLAMAVVLVVVLGDLRFALFAMMSPIMAIGMYFDQKRRHKKGLKEEEERYTEALETFRGEIVEAAAVETVRRQDTIPDPAVVMRRPALPSTLMWQRRADAHDFLRLHVGVGDEPWKPELDLRGSSKLPERTKEVFETSSLTAAPVLADLNDAGVIGIVGDRDGALALARSLIVQAAVHCGPADLTISAFCDNGRENDWDWTAWLPHTRQAGGEAGARWLSNHRDASSTMLRNLLDNIANFPTPAMLTVLDSEVLTEGRDAPARDLLGTGRPISGASQQREERKVSGIVIATSQDKLPASCTIVVDVGADAAATVHHPENLTRVDDVVIAGVSLADAEDCARTIAHFEDPELVIPGASLPSLVRLPELLGADTMNADTIRDWWTSSDGIATPVGLGENGSLSLDIVKDGPHGLVGGTTGSGKSEFLRSFVAGLAARNDPTKLNFILIDFKGGAAFKACERLPHTIGTISNLDEQLADRALRALEAEMERRQRLFAEAGEDVDNLPAYLATNPAEPLPRLLLVIDEFAMLAKDFPDVLASLVSVGAVGRTLGVHMILATQRPAGVVNDDILANTNLRVALRVQSREDSSNVIGVPDAPSISRLQQGRAYIKLGQNDITPVQTALVTGRAQEKTVEKVQVREVGLFGVPAPGPAPAKTRASDANDLDLLIDAVVEANTQMGIAPPRQVWPEALGECVSLDGYAVDTTQIDDDARPVPTVGGVEDEVVQVALADEPDLQRQSPAGWKLDQGNLFLMGVPGSGTSTTLASIALALADARSPEDLDILCLDMGSRGLSALENLPHTVAYVGSGSGAREQQVRFLRHLRTEFQRRRAATTPSRPAIILVDGLAALRDEFQDHEGQSLLDMFYRVYADGPSVGMHFAVSTTRSKSVPSAMDEVTLQRWVYRLADTYDYSTLGVRGKTIPAPVPGRCVDTTTLLQMHIATPGKGLESAVAEAAARWAHIPAKPDAIGVLPDDVPASQLASLTRLDGEPAHLPIGVREDTLAPALLELYEGEHVLIAGPPRSGKSTLLLAIAELVRQAPDDQRPQLWGLCDRRSPLRHADFDRVAGSSDEIPALLASLRLENKPVFLFVDDAERVEDTDQSLNNLLAASPVNLTVVAAGRGSDLRGLYSHWTKTLRKARCGVLLQPDVDYDGELLGVKIPRTAPVALTPGRGYACVSGGVALVQTISPSDSD